MRLRRSRYRRRRRRLRQQRIDEIEQPRDAAAMPFDELAPTGARSLPHLRVGEELLQDFGSARRIGDFHRTARAHQRARDVPAVGIVGARDHRHAERGRLQQIVPAHRHQASADERHIGRRIQRGRVRPRCRPAALARPAAPLARCCADRSEFPAAPAGSPRSRSAADAAAPASAMRPRTSRAARRARRAAAPPRRHGCCRRSTRASRRHSACAVGAPAPGPGAQGCISNFTLPMTCVRARVGADGDEALGILGGLRRDDAAARHRAAEQACRDADTATRISPSGAHSRAPPARRAAGIHRADWATVPSP